MGAYIVRRLLLIIPTLLGVMIINFVLTQALPGGPVEQAIAEAMGQGNVLETITGGGSETSDHAKPATSSTEDFGYRGARGLPKEFIEALEKQFGFDKPPLERFLRMM